MSDTPMTPSQDKNRLRWVKVSQEDFAAMQRNAEPCDTLLGIPVWTSHYAPPGDVTLFYYEPPPPPDLDAILRAFNPEGSR